MRRLACIAALALSAAAATALGNEAQPTPAPTPPVREVVPAWKLEKAVDGWRRARAESRRLRRSLDHSPSVAEAKAIASILYGVPRDELDHTVYCESTDNPRARNGRYRGNLQLGPIFEGTPFGGLDVFSPYVNIIAGAYIWKTGGRSWAPWECSPHGAFQP